MLTACGAALRRGSEIFLIVTNLSASRGNECFPDLILKAISFCKLIETYSATWDEDDKDLFFFCFRLKRKCFTCQ